MVFLFPYILFSLITLPAIWFLLRVLPPAPKKVFFPALMILKNLKKTETPSDKTPWWILLLRVFALALLILALSEPVSKMSEELAGVVDKTNKTRPVLLLIDNGWIAGQNWQDRKIMAIKIVEEIRRSGRNMIILPTASKNTPLNIISADNAKAVISHIQPEPWASSYKDVIDDINKITKKVDTFWLSSGYHSADNSSHRLLNDLRLMGRVTVVDANDEVFFPTLIELKTGLGKNELKLSVHRLSAPKQNIPVTILLYDDKNHVLGQQKLSFPKGETEASKTITIDVEKRNRLAKIKIQQSSHAGGIFMVDENWRFRPVGIAATKAMLDNQSYLNDVFYLTRALEPYVDMHKGRIKAMLEKSKLAVILLSDDYPFILDEKAMLHEWVKKGGMLIRFAGENLAENTEHDELLPVDLRYGGRYFEGNLTWETEQSLKEFAEKSPFSGLIITDDKEITISKQVLAKPSLEMEKLIWARLQDDTPLVTGRKEGLGYMVLFHTTANPEWSNLSISGVFVEMLRRLVAFSSGVTNIDSQNTKLFPIKVLDGFGSFQAPDKYVSAIENQHDFKVSIGSPPGFYGQNNMGADVAKSFNLINYIDLPSERIIKDLVGDVTVLSYFKAHETTYKPYLLVLSLLLLALDFILSLHLRGILRKSVVAILVIMFLLSSTPSFADDNTKEAIKYTTKTWIAYVKTGDETLDRTSKQGLEALARLISRRTSAKVAGAVAVNPETDILTYFPFIYWSISNSSTSLSAKAQENILSYMGNGGLILFDTRESKFNSSDNSKLKKLLRGMSIPSLQAVPEKHALTRSYYLLKDFPGRYKGDKLWVEKRPALDHDNVPSIMIGSHDWAAAWARKDNGQPVYKISSGGERQREMAYRFGVNVIMMALTGNYKVDQIHTKALLNRLGTK